MILATLLSAVLAQDARLAVGEVQLAGPFDGATLDCGPRGRVELRGSLLAGERRTLTVPLPGQPLDGAPPRVEGATFLGYGEAPAPLPPALRRRSRPPVEGQAPVADPTGLLVLLAGAAVVLAARRRPAAAAGGGVLVAAAVFGLQVRHPAEAPTRTRVLEGDGAAWMLVEGAAGSLPIAETDLALEVDPARSPLRLVGELGEGWIAQGPALWRRAALDPGARRLDGRLNLWGGLEQAWVRSPEGTWTARGAWGLGEPLPGPLSGSGAGSGPPGWLAAGLPQGRGVLVARPAPGAWAGGPGPGGVPEVVWLRLVGFDFAGGR